MTVYAQVTGSQRLLSRLNQRVNEYGKRFRAATNKVGVELLHDSLYLVPMMTGDLYDTGFVQTDGALFQAVTTVGYTSPYAASVHENPYWAHGEEFNQKHAAAIASASATDPFYFKRRDQEQYKFLEQPLREGLGTFVAIIRSDMGV